MAEEQITVGLHDDFYRDNFGKVIVAIVIACCLIAFLTALSVYIHMSKPPPVTFGVAKEWRVQAPVPVQKPYLTNPEVLQWVSDVIPNAFDLNFLHLDAQLEDLKKYFTDNGYQVFLNQLNNYIDKRKLEESKLFVNAQPTAAPSIKNQGALNARYAWWVKIPVEIKYSGLRVLTPVNLTLDVLVVRTETTNNLDGVLIDNVIVDAGTGLKRRRTR